MRSSGRQALASRPHLVELVDDDYPDGHILVELDGASDHPLRSANPMASRLSQGAGRRHTGGLSQGAQDREG